MKLNKSLMKKKLMSDITKCANGKNCPLKASCYRWTAPDSEFQSYENFYDKTDP